MAGLEIGGDRIGGWIRPVSSRHSEEISLADRRFEDGSDPTLLDIIEIPLLEPRPRGCQTENHLIDDESYWVKVGEFSSLRLAGLCKVPNPLWVNGFSSYNGLNDRIPENQSDSLGSSLVLVEPKDLVIAVEQGLKKRQVRANFAWQTSRTNLLSLIRLSNENSSAVARADMPTDEVQLRVYPLVKPFRDTATNL